jgi:RimJ/RimL family protein N-acetyltransferase
MLAEEYNTIIRGYKEKFFGKYVGYNDLETCLNMWHDLMTIGGGIHPPQRALINWARDNSINNKKIRELLKIVEQSVNASNRIGYPVEIGPFTTNGVMTAARPILLSVYSVLTMIHKRDITYINPLTREDYRLDTRDAVNQFSSNPPKGVIALVTAEIKTKSGKFRVIGFGVDTDKDGLGRPIIVKGFTQQQRGPRTITRNPATVAIPPTVADQIDINDALGLLAGLNLGTPKARTPTAFDLLDTLTSTLVDIQPPVVVLPPNILPPPKTVEMPSPMENNQNIDAAMDLLTMLDLTTPTAHNIITIIPIDKATSEQLDALSVIGSDERIYRHLGKGNPWDRKHVEQLHQHAIDDKLQGNKDYLHWIVLLDNIVVGYVGIHPTGSPRFPGSQLRSFVAPNYMNRGIATTAKLLMIQALDSPTTLWSFITPTNLPSIRVAEKTGFTFSGQARIGNTLVNVYSRSI